MLSKVTHILKNSRGENVLLYLLRYLPFLRLFLHSQRPRFLSGFVSRRAERTSYNISFTAGLLLMGFCSFSSSENVSFFALIIKEYFCCIQNSELTMLFLQALWRCYFFGLHSVWRGICKYSNYCSLYIVCHFSLAAFKIFFPLVLSHLIMMCIGIS